MYRALKKGAIVPFSLALIFVGAASPTMANPRLLLCSYATCRPPQEAASTERAARKASSRSTSVAFTAPSSAGTSGGLANSGRRVLEARLRFPFSGTPGPRRARILLKKRSSFRAQWPRRRCPRLCLQRDRRRRAELHEHFWLRTVVANARDYRRPREPGHHGDRLCKRQWTVRLFDHGPHRNLPARRRSRTLHVGPDAAWPRWPRLCAASRNSLDPGGRRVQTPNLRPSRLFRVHLS